MAEHTVIVQTSDKLGGVKFTPSSLSAQPGDIITFQSTHLGKKTL